jgi:hypothetical protein
MVANRRLQWAKSRPSGKMGSPAGRTPYPNGQALFRRDLLSATQCKRTNSNHSGPRNRSACWRRPYKPRICLEEERKSRAILDLVAVSASVRAHATYETTDPLQN